MCWPHVCSYQQLKQACWQRGRAALQQGARFLLHRADGSTHHVLLYLTQAGSSRGGGQQTSRLANNQRQEQQPQQQPRSSGGLVLVLAALPETRKQARAAYRRLAATAADGQSSERPSSDSTSSPSAPPAGSSAGAALGNTGAPSPRMSALGAVSAGLRLRMQRGTLLQLGYESGKFPRQTLSTLKTIPVTQLVGIVRGSTNAAAARVVSSAGGAFDGSTRGVGQSFDLLVQEELRGDVTAIRLQVPAVGNGRSVSEWVAALRDVAVASSPAAPAGARQFHGRPATEAGTPAAGRVRGELHSDADLQEDEVQAERDAEGATGSRTASGQQPQWVEPEMVAPQCNGSRGSLDQQVLEAHDWMLPSAAGRTPKPWAGRVTEGSAGAGLDSSSCSSASNSSDADDA